MESRLLVAGADQGRSSHNTEIQTLTVCHILSVWSVTLLVTVPFVNVPVIWSRSAG